MINFNKVRIPKEIKVDPRFEKLPLKPLFITSIVINLIFLLIGVLSIFILPPVVPIFYGLPKTSEQLGNSFFIILPSLISLLLIVTNAIIAINLESQYLKRTLAFSSFLVSILNMITTYKIIALVGSL